VACDLRKRRIGGWGSCYYGASGALARRSVAGNGEVEEPCWLGEFEGSQDGLLAGGGRGALRDLTLGARRRDQVHPVEFVADVAPGVSSVAFSTTRTYLGARYRRTASRRGAMKANVAIQHAMLVIIWQLLTTGALYQDLGADYYTSLRPNRAKNRAVAQLQALGFTITLTSTS